MFRTDTDSKSGIASFYNNIFYNMGNSMGSGSNPYGNFTWSHNVFYGNFQSFPNDGNRLTSDPGFTNPGSGGDGRTTVDGYTLQAGSPCIDSGRSVTDNGGKDYWGNTLYYGSPDRGAHEYQGGNPTPGPVLLGDVDTNGTVDIVDALMVAQYYVGLPVSINTQAADVNNDGAIDITDALLIAQVYVGILPGF
jgi:hypothetical protein